MCQIKEEIFLIWHIESQPRIRNDLRFQIGLHKTGMETVVSGYQQCVGEGSESGTLGSECKASILKWSIAWPMMEEGLYESTSNSRIGNIYNISPTFPHFL